ncbi:hypothetical protein DFH07DRAFT_770937 [Mycena maculata]|uniref:Uncharacterized protein n=1 Tax=Mycena maculata TaxID=230809 RepID=A0AAD7JI77_9AGAR|nr:hypothetical protein DFH07DRAFT_770937 [Mycena maculata]
MMLSAALPLFFIPLISSSGASQAVSDITPTGGWVVLACDAGSLVQDIRLVCSTSSCEHLFEGQGAIDTVIRLPETCGLGASARVTNIQVDSNQSLPSNVSAIIEHTGNITSTVFLLSVDVDFAAANSTRTGPISFSLKGYNFPADTSNSNITTRGLQTRDNWTAFNKTDSEDFPILNIDETFPLVSKDIDCDGITASVSAGFSTNIQATVSAGAIAIGTIIPPIITELAVFAGLDASVLGTLNLLASATSSIATGKVSLYSVSLAGINFPGIFSLGTIDGLQPTFGIYGELVTDLDTDVSVSVDLAYNVNNAQVFIPAAAQTLGGSFSLADTSLTLSVLPGVTSNTTVEAHIIPEVKIGLNAFSIITADVYFDVDGTATITLDLDSSANATATGDGTDAASGSVNGSVDIVAAFSTTVGVTGSIFGISDSDSDTLFSDEWTLYKTSLADSTKHDSVAICSPPASGLARHTDLTCPASSTLIADIEKIVDQVIAAAQL